MTEHKVQGQTKGDLLSFKMDLAHELIGNHFMAKHQTGRPWSEMTAADWEIFTKSEGWLLTQDTSFKMRKMGSIHLRQNGCNAYWQFVYLLNGLTFSVKLHTSPSTCTGKHLCTQTHTHTDTHTHIRSQPNSTDKQTTTVWQQEKHVHTHTHTHTESTQQYW